MPLIYQCGNCGTDHAPIEEQHCEGCSAEICSECRENGLCYDCADAARNENEDPRDYEEDDVEFEDEEVE